MGSSGVAAAGATASSKYHIHIPSMACVKNSNVSRECALIHDVEDEESI